MRATVVQVVAEVPTVDGSRPSRHPVLAQGARYLVVGVAATAVNAVLFYVLRTWWAPMPASLVSLVASTALSTEAHRRFTFGVGDALRWRVHLQSAGTVVFYAGYSAVVLAVLGVLLTAPTRLQETLAIAAASVLGGITRFLLLRQWVFAPALPIRSWSGTVRGMARIPRSTVRRSVMALVAGAAVLLSTAGACGGGDDDDDDGGGVPGVTQQDEGDDGDDD